MDAYQSAVEVVRIMRGFDINDHRLVLVVGSAGSGKTRVLKEIQKLTSAPRVNVSLELGRRLLAYDAAERGAKAAFVFEQMLSGLKREDGAYIETVLLDDLEVFFDPSFEMDTLETIRNASKDRTLIVGWPGSVKDGVLTFGEHGRPRYKEYRDAGVETVVL